MNRRNIAHSSLRLAVAFVPALAIATVIGCSPDANDIGDSSGASSGPPVSEDSGSTVGSTGVTTSSSGSGTAGSSTTGPTAGTGDSGAGESGNPTVGATVVFVNFDGADIQAAMTDDAASNASSLADGIAALAGPHPSYGVGAKRDAVLDEVRRQFAAYDVGVTDSRPASGDYVMIMVGPSNALTPAIAVAPLDCDDQNPRNIGFVDASIADGLTAEATATAISSQLGATYGMQRVDLAADIMGPLAGTDFLDLCAQVTNPTCAPAAPDACTNPGEQNSHQELLALWGPA